MDYRVLRYIGVVVLSVSFGISIAWQVEAATCGFCTISQHLAPVAIIGNMVGLLLVVGSSLAARRRSQSGKDTRPGPPGAAGPS